MLKYAFGAYWRDGEIKREEIRPHILYARFHLALYYFPATKAAREYGNMCHISVIRTNERENNPTRYGDINARAHTGKNIITLLVALCICIAAMLCFSRFVRVTERFSRSLFCIVLGRCEIIWSYVQT